MTMYGFTAAGHTPGPWKLETVQTTSGICHKIGPFPWKEGKQNHACIYVDYPNHNNCGQFEDELTANARLIAAAPRYHAAAEEMLRVAEVGVVNDLEAFGRAIRLLREAHAATNGSRG